MPGAISHTDITMKFLNTIKGPFKPVYMVLKMGALVYDKHSLKQSAKSQMRYSG